MKPSATADCFGNPLDAAVGYARGQLLPDSVAETRRLRQAKLLLQERLHAHGEESVFDFTGSPGEFPLAPGDSGIAMREVPGAALLVAKLTEEGVRHMGAGAGHDVALFNRTSAGIVAALLALVVPGETVVSVTPGVLSHPSINRGASLARNDLREVLDPGELQAALAATRGRIVVITGVSSELAVMAEADFRGALRDVSASGRIALVDDAYGARIRTVLFRQPHALAGGADLAITSIQKAGLGGPRAGLLAGRADLVSAVVSRASELGLEARTPLALATLRTLQRFEPEHLMAEVRAGKALYEQLITIFGGDAVVQTPLGPVVSAEDVLMKALDGAAVAGCGVRLMPSEASAILGLLLLQNHGMITVNAFGMPGARVALRLKTNECELRRFGRTGAVAAALDDSLTRLRFMMSDADAIRGLMFGSA